MRGGSAGVSPGPRRPAAETDIACDWHGLRLPAMSKLFSILFILLMGAHLVRPLGLPGLRRRGDFWKIAAVGFVVFGLIILLRPE